MWRERVGQEGDRKIEGETGVGDGESETREREWGERESGG